MQTSSQIVTIVKPTPDFFLQAGCPSCRPTNSVKAVKGKYHTPWTCLPQAHLGVFQLCLRPLIAPGYLGGGLPCLLSALWRQYSRVMTALYNKKAWTVHTQKLCRNQTNKSGKHKQTNWFGQTGSCTDRWTCQRLCTCQARQEWQHEDHGPRHTGTLPYVGPKWDIQIHSLRRQ